MKLIAKPNEGEYAQYALMYIDLLPNDGKVLMRLKENIATTINFVLSIPGEKLTYRYAPGKWTIKEIFQHIIDDERIFVYRALRYARNDNTELPGFEQDDFAKNSFANERSVSDLLEEYIAVRNGTVAFFSGLDDNVLTRKGIGSGSIMSVRAAAYHIAGHELHHINFIKEKYLRQD